MQNTAWALLLRQFPVEMHNTLMFVTRGGTEIAIQMILRIDHEHFAIRGRLSGSTDSNRLIITPYDQIDYFGTQQQIKETEYHAIFGKVEFPSEPATSVSEVELAAELPEPEPEPEPITIAEPTSGRLPPPSTKTPLPIKSAILERFRARSNPGSNFNLPRSNEG